MIELAMLFQKPSWLFSAVIPLICLLDFVSYSVHCQDAARTDLLSNLIDCSFSSQSKNDTIESGKCLFVGIHV